MDFASSYWCFISDKYFTCIHSYQLTYLVIDEKFGLKFRTHIVHTPIDSVIRKVDESRG